MDRNDIVGKVFGKLTVIECVGIIDGRTSYLCKCTCGGAKVVARGPLLAKKVKSCGCLHRPAAEKVKRPAKPLSDATIKRLHEYDVAMQTEINKDKFNDDWMFGEGSRSPFASNNN